MPFEPPFKGMKLYRIRKHAGIYQLNLEDQAVLFRPGEGQIAVRVAAVSLNYRDLLVLSARVPGFDPEGLIPASDAAGVVIAVGKGVTRFRVGDRVTSSLFQQWSRGPATAEGMRSTLGGPLQGVLAEEIVLSEDGAVLTPEYLNDVEACTLPSAALTAWNSLFTRGRLKAGEMVLFLGTGGVSVFGLQFAVTAGAHAIVVSPSDIELRRAKGLGATYVINSLVHPHWEKEVLALTGGRGVNQVLEVGGAGPLSRSIEAVSYQGHIAFTGLLADSTRAIDPYPLAHKNATLSGVWGGSREEFETMNAFLETGQIRPVIDRIFSFDRAAEAYDYLRRAPHFGKVVIQYG